MKHFVYYFILIMSSSMYCQNENGAVDYKIIKDQKISDKQKIDRFILSFEQNRFTDSIKTIKILDEGLLWSKTINDIALQSQMHTVSSSFFNQENQKNTKESEHHKNQAILLAQQSKDDLSLALAFIEKGIYEKFSNNFDLAISSFLQAVDYALKTTDYHTQTRAYYYLSDIYKSIGDYDNQLIAAKQCLQTAQQSSFKNADLARAHFAMGNSYTWEYNEDKTKKRSNFDLGLYHYKKVIFYTNKADAYRKRALAEANYDIATLYYYKDRIKNKDIILNYLLLANSFSEKYNSKWIYCMNRLMRIEYLYQENNLLAVEKLLKEVEKYYFSFENDYKVLNAFELYNEKLYEKKGDKAEALLWCKDFVVSSQKLYSLERNLTVKKAEAKYINKTKILELEQTKKDYQYQRNLKYLAFALAIMSAFGLFFVFRYYKSRQHQQLIREELLQIQKDEAELYGKLQEQEAKQIAIEKQMEQQQKEQFQKQFMASVLQVERKNEILLNLKTAIKENEFLDKNKEIKKINKIIDNGIALDDDFENFKMNFENVYPSFFSQLQQKANGELTQLDMKYCAYINMGLSSKEIANLLNIEDTSVRMTKYRLKQKLALSKEEDLGVFISSVA
jgi:DNA-binding CsgD family transcriptional regulator